MLDDHFQEDVLITHPAFALDRHWNLVTSNRALPILYQGDLRPFFVAETSQAMSDWVLNMMAQTPLYALIACNRALSTEDFRSALPKIRLSTLIHQGDADVSAPLPITGRKTAALTPKAELKVYEGAPHSLIYTHMSRVNADIEAFSKLP